jgi:hypothetical protein
VEAWILRCCRIGAQSHREKSDLHFCRSRSAEKRGGGKRRACFTKHFVMKITSVWMHTERFRSAWGGHRTRTQTKNYRRRIYPRL